MKKLDVKTVKGLAGRVAKIVADETMNKSNKMKALFDLGLDVKEISKQLDVRYNFVYNVISNYVLINGIEVDNARQGSKKDKVLELLDDGRSVKEICVELQCNMNYVYKIKKGWQQGRDAFMEQMAMDK